MAGQAQLLWKVLHWIGGPPLAAVILSTGIYLMARYRFLPLRRFGSAFRLTFGSLFSSPRKQLSAGDISPYQALTTALAATVGTGNIAGVATAITLGGPGAIFWMWVSALFGLAIKFSEIVLAVYFRRRAAGGYIAGGPMYVLEQGLHSRWLGLWFAFFASLAAFGIGNLVQANSAAAIARKVWGLPPLLTGLVLAFITAAVILGGIERIGSFTSRLIPLMALLYIGGAVIILVLRYQQIPLALAEIFKGAVTGRAAAGGFAGAGMLQALRYGAARGVFSNEAGLGSASIAHAAAKTDHPVRQGLWGIMEVFIDTHLVCTVTGLVIIVTGAWTTTLEGASLTAEAFARGLHGPGEMIVGIGLLLFAFSTLISWSYYGEKSFEYLTGGGQVFYRLLWAGLVVLGATGQLRQLWALADALNAMMAFPNLVGVLSLSGLVIKLNRQFWKH
ncbi:MAG TPA: sodium:alanine symporter family protein [Firmicutes bacterium]|nr:sodium:alanine symporter family protein [Bacillota bacterium]